MNKKILYSILLVLLLADLSYSFMQYYNDTLDGDLPNSIPESSGMIQKLYASPLGTAVIFEGARYPNPNRFFSHWSLHEYFNHMPQFLQHITGPVNSVYLSTGIFKLVVHVLLLFLLAVLITSRINPARTEFIGAMLAATVFFQANGHLTGINVVLQSTTYTFFYSWPLLLLLLYFTPFVLASYHRRFRWNHPVIVILWISLALVVNLSGPLNPGVILVAAFGVAAGFWSRTGSSIRAKNFLHKMNTLFRQVPAYYWFFWLPAVLFALYSLYLGQFNTNTMAAQKSLAALYSRLPGGIYKEMLTDSGFLFLLGAVLFNMLFIRFTTSGADRKNALKPYKWAGLFIVLYLLLLPLGGYRDYRPGIVRWDTLMPVSITLIFLFGYSTLFLAKTLKLRQRRAYFPVLLLLALKLTLADVPHFHKNDCERAAMKTIAASEKQVVPIPYKCRLLSWKPITNPEQSVYAVRVLQIWNVVEADKRFYNKEAERD